MNKGNLHIIFVILFMVILVAPGVQMAFRLIPEKELHGVDFEEIFPDLSFSSWYHFQYQPHFQDYIQDNYGFRPFFIRLFNQIDYSIFREPHGLGVILGKEGFLFEEWFITAHFGENIQIPEITETSVQRLKAIRRYLNDRKKELLVVIAPSKADFWPEYIPSRYKDTLGNSNYLLLASSLRKAEIPLVDFNRWFLQLKDKVPYPLFPKTGTHWSHFGARLALDSLSDKLAEILYRPIPDIQLLPSGATDLLIRPDFDLEELMNLFFPLERLSMSYPEVRFEKPDETPLPRAIVIGDSFFWDIFNVGLEGRIFETLQFWYYNSSVYPESFDYAVHTSDLDLTEVIDNTDLVVLFACPPNIQGLGWGFIERAFIELVVGISREDWNKEYSKMVKEYIQAIRNTPAWLHEIQEKAQKWNIPLDSMMMIDARFMVDDYILKGGL